MFKKFAVIKLDPPETHSTGGMVEKTIYFLEGTYNINGAGGKFSTDNEKEDWNDKVTEYKLVQIEDDSPVTTGWIYTDKTNELIAP
tara:strand:- start:159 stop:416 length:258 start_codon:yes stop_codon:yes gene_type:complete